MTSNPRSHPLTPPLIGRTKELSDVIDALQSVQTSDVRVLLIAGEPGVGKSRLMHESAAAAAHLGWRVLIGHSYHTEGMPPYLPFIEALEDHVRSADLGDLKQQLGDDTVGVSSLFPELRR